MWSELRGSYKAIYATTKSTWSETKSLLFHKAMRVNTASYFQQFIACKNSLKSRPLSLNSLQLNRLFHGNNHLNNDNNSHHQHSPRFAVCKRCAKCSICIVLFHPHMVQSLLLSLFFRWRNQDSERLGNLLQVTQPFRSRAQQLNTSQSSQMSQFMFSTTFYSCLSTFHNGSVVGCLLCGIWSRFLKEFQLIIESS